MKMYRYMLFGLLVAMVLGACQPPPAPAAVPTPDPAIATLKAEAEQVAANKAVMDKFLELFGTGAWDEFDQVIATDCILHYPGGVDVVGLDAMVAAWQDFFPKLKDMTFTSQGEVSEGDLMMEFITFEATYEGDYMGQEITDVPIKYNQVEMQRYKDGKIVEWWVENDRLWMAEQLGMELVPATPTSLSNFPTGTFAAKDGDWVLTFDDDGNNTFSQLGTVEASSTYAIQGNELTWQTDSYCDRIGKGKATYTWTFEDDILLFQVKGEDKCSDRLSVLDDVPYKKEQS